MAVSYTYLQKNGIPFLTQVAMGRIPGVYSIIAWGVNNNVGTSPEMLWSTTSTSIEVQHQTAEPLTVISSSGDDTAGGTGWRRARIYGLDANFNLIQEEVVMNGLAGVTTVLEFIRVNKVVSLEVGSLTASAGQITVINSSLQLCAVGDAGVNQLDKCYFAVPAGFYGLLYSARMTPRGAFAMESRIITRTLDLSEGGTSGGVTGQGNGTITFESPLLITPRTEVFLTANPISGTQAIDGTIQMLIMPEAYVVQQQNIFAVEP